MPDHTEESRHDDSSHHERQPVNREERDRCRRAQTHAINQKHRKPAGKRPFVGKLKKEQQGEDDCKRAAQIADRLREQCLTETGWLGGTFPGDNAALTALAAEPDGAGWRWQTWHLYPAAPGGGTVVYTTSRWRP